MAFSGHPKWKVDSMSVEEACGNGPEKGQAWNWDTFPGNAFPGIGRENVVKVPSTAVTDTYHDASYRGGQGYNRSVEVSNQTGLA
jgi:hypothetical protein